MSVTYPRGFRAAGVAAGLKPSGSPDLGLLVADDAATAAGLFTTNLVAAAPVVLGRERLAAGAPTAVLVNSGQANAATGERGLADAAAAAAAAAGHLGLDAEAVLPCSTGVIGEPVHMAELLDALPSLVASLDVSGGPAFANAIRTTDTVDKQAVAGAAGGVRVGGCAKGVGMISPNLATMLAFVTTDAAVARDDLQRLAAEQLAPRFNALTVDGCTSTNDTLLLFASGAAGGDQIRPGARDWDALAAAVGEVGESLLRQLAADGEGVTRVMLVEVRGAATERDARALAAAVADSPLVKTAAFGADPNPGRILQAVGAAGVAFDPRRLDVAIGGVEVAHAGVIPPLYFEPGSDLYAGAQAAMKESEVAIGVTVGDGPGSSRALGCDLSYEYVRINGEYTT
jgi:glutamate N-acetyltransferase/amino-acid N-acetyltransferase